MIVIWWLSRLRLSTRIDARDLTLLYLSVAMGAGKKIWNSVQKLGFLLFIFHGVPYVKSKPELVLVWVEDLHFVWDFSSTGIFLSCGPWVCLRCLPYLYSILETTLKPTLLGSISGRLFGVAEELPGSLKDETAYPKYHLGNWFFLLMFKRSFTAFWARAFSPAYFI